MRKSSGCVHHQGGHKAPPLPQTDRTVRKSTVGTHRISGNAKIVGTRVRASPCGCPRAISSCGCPRVARKSSGGIHRGGEMTPGAGIITRAGTRHQGGHKAPPLRANRRDGEKINRGNAPHIGQCENRRDPSTGIPLWVPSHNIPLWDPRRRIIKKIGKLFGIITIFHIPPNTILRYIIIIIGIFGYRI